MKNNKMNKKKKLNRRVPRNIIRAINRKILDTQQYLALGIPAVIPLNVLTQGVDFTQRIANTIRPLKVDMNFRLSAGAALIGSVNAVVRLLLITDKQQVDATTPISGDILSPVTTIGRMNYIYRNRWQVHFDRKYKINAFDFADTQYNIQTKSKLDIMRYSTTFGNSITKNGFYLLALSDNNVNPPTLDLFVRIWFVDC